MTTAISERISVLLADDSDIARGAIRDAVGRSIESKGCRRGEEFHRTLNLLVAVKPKIVLMDMHMPGEVDPATGKSKLSDSLLLGLYIWNDDETRAMAKKWGAVRLLDKVNLFTELGAVISEIAP